MYLLFGQFQSSMNFLHVVSSEEKKEERVQDCKDEWVPGAQGYYGYSYHGAKTTIEH